jgi:hypothetical protein
MANEYDAPDEVRLTATITDSAGVATDPTGAVIIVKKPDGTYVGYSTSFGFTDQGAWSAATNTPTLANGTGTAGHYYTNSAAGSVDFGDGSITFAVNDWVFYNGRIWRRLHSPSATNLTKSATGIYYVDQYTSQAGTWYYRQEGVNTRMGAETPFQVKSSEF